jgi:hypothetical protein
VFIKCSKYSLTFFMKGFIANSKYLWVYIIKIHFKWMRQNTNINSVSAIYNFPQNYKTTGDKTNEKYLQLFWVCQKEEHMYHLYLFYPRLSPMMLSLSSECSPAILLCESHCTYWSSNLIAKPGNRTVGIYISYPLTPHTHFLTEIPQRLH